MHLSHLLQLLLCGLHPSLPLLLCPECGKGDGLPHALSGQLFPGRGQDVVMEEKDAVSSRQAVHVKPHVLLPGKICQLLYLLLRQDLDCAEVCPQHDLHRKSGASVLLLQLFYAVTAVVQGFQPLPAEGGRQIAALCQLHAALIHALRGQELLFYFRADGREFIIVVVIEKRKSVLACEEGVLFQVSSQVSLPLLRGIAGAPRHYKIRPLGHGAPVVRTPGHHKSPQGRLHPEGQGQDGEEEPAPVAGHILPGHEDKLSLW